MDIDPEFEFECPKWYDFAKEEDGEFEECLDDSWFEREHPLHEPKDKEKNNRELKPLIEINERQTDNKKTITSKSEENTKYKNPKKSLGVKRSVRLMRGDHGPAGRRKLPETTRLNRRNSSEKLKNNKEPRSGGRVDEKKSSRDEFCENRDFTPPWGFGSPSRPVMSEETDISPKTALLSSPLRGPLMSPPVNSPKNTTCMFAKAVSKAAVTHHKRRILPTIPCSIQVDITKISTPYNYVERADLNQEISTHLPLRGTSQSEAPNAPLSLIESGTKTKEHSDRSPTRDTPNDNQLFNPVRLNSDSNSNDEMSDYQRQRGVDQTGDEKQREDSPMSVEDLLKLHNQKVFASKSKYDSNGRRIQSRSVMSAVGPEGLCNRTDVMKTDDQDSAEEYFKEKEVSCSPIAIDNLDIIREERNKESQGLKPESKNENQEMTAEVLLRLHNQRVMASKCKYDSNGRRIRTANPVFCAAPSKSDVTKKPSVTRSKGRRSGATTSGHKRLSSSSDPEPKTNTKLKQHCKSCADAPMTQGTIYGSTKRKDERNNGNENERKKSTITAAPQDVNSKSSGSNLKRNAITQDTKCGQKNKRRSCVAAPVSSLQFSGTSKGIGVAGPNLQKRQKRRSCVAAPQTPRRPGPDNIDQELKDLIARHNQRLAMNK